VYFIYMNNGPGDTWSADPSLGNLVSGLGASAYHQVAASLGATTQISYGGAIHYTSYDGSVQDYQVQVALSRITAAGQLPSSYNAIYVFFTSPSLPWAGEALCGYHSTYTGLNYALVRYDGNVCGDHSPNYEGSILAHEIEETVTDPNINAWYDASGCEIGDKCAWIMGTTWIGGQSWYIQSEWLNQAGACEWSRGYAPGQYVGCFVDSPNRALPYQAPGGSNTPQSCKGACNAAGYTYSGVQYYGQCFCGNTLQFDLRPDGECNTPCSADGSQMCGGPWRNSIYMSAPGGSGGGGSGGGGGGPDLASGASLHAGDSRTSSDGRFVFTYQGDGNLVLYQQGTAIWSSGTNGTSANGTSMQGDGNLVVYDASGTPRWASGTAGYSGSHLTVQSDGNTVIYTPSGQPVWSTGTCCR
jgi:hypothetical protein